MKSNYLKKIGILGGMGPLATRDLYDWIIQLTPAKSDQDHLPVVINSAPQIPDRTDYILGKGEDPKPQLLQAAKQLEKMGVDLMAIPCNTSHIFLDFLKVNLPNIEFVDMIKETKNYINQLFQSKKPKIGLLATDGTIKTKLYHRYFREYKLVTPSKTIQMNMVMEAIYGHKGIKRGYVKPARFLIREAIRHLKNRGAKIIILGCTEISAVLRNEKNNGIVYINPAKILAQTLIKKVQRDN